MGDTMKSTVLSVLFLALIVATSGCKGPFAKHMPAEMMMPPGPGIDGPGPGVVMYPPSMPTPSRTSQVYFVGPRSMRVAWDVSAPGQFDSEPMFCPGRYNFQQGAIYRLKLTDIPNRPGVELYPTLEVGPGMPRTEAFLSHSPIPMQLTEEDFDQVLSGNFVTKVIYLPDSEFQETALAGVETLVSTRLDPGMDPIVEADRRGAILAIVRIGGIDLEVPGDVGEEGVFQASYGDPISAGGYAAPMGTAVGSGGTIPTTHISGVNAPQYGIPMTSTPIGLPGPPYLPRGYPAGLQKHTVVNHSKTRIPHPTKRVRYRVHSKSCKGCPTSDCGSACTKGRACAKGPAAYSGCADGQTQY